ncbi:MAG: helix-turn-helix transcriptional regulator [Thermoleophilia bacterium]|nr:helix-turn-helix transcriptional regulator [Thermoleophilia bacterium]
MRAETSLERAIREYEKDPEFVLEGMLWDINDQIARAMKKQNISRAELARRLDTSRSYVTKLLRGTTNVTLQSLARVAIALGSEISISLSAAQQPVEVRIRTAVPSVQRLHPVRHFSVGRSGADPGSLTEPLEFGLGADSEARKPQLITLDPTSSAGTELPSDRVQYA